MKPGKRKKPGRLITLEGIEGVGKSTHLRFIAGHLRKHGLDVLVTREPGGVPVSEAIRKILLDNRHNSLPPMAELLLMFAARAVHVTERIRPTLEAGTWVVCDRFTDASYAYQGGGRGLPNRTIETLERMVLGGIRPDLTLLLDAPVRVGLGRIRRRGRADRFEREHSAFFERVRRTYLARARHAPRRIHVIHAARDLTEIQADIASVLDEKVKRWR